MLSKMRLLLLLVLVCATPCRACYDVLGVGFASVDLLFNVDKHFLEEWGADHGGSKTVSWKHFSDMLASQRQGPSIITAGGSCANTIRALSRLGNRCALHGMVGEDTMGQYFINQLCKDGVDPLLIPRATPTQQVACLLTGDKQRSFLVYLGAAGEMDQRHLHADHFSECRLVHVEGYALYNDDMVQQAMILAKKNGTLVSFDVGCFQLARSFREKILAFSQKHVDILFANEEEALQLTDLSDPLHACAKLGSYVPCAVVLAGSHGCYVAANGEVIHVPVRQVQVTDTIGAGDFFAAGFLHKYLQGGDARQCAANGNLLGSSVVQVHGTNLTDAQWQQVLQQ